MGVRDGAAGPAWSCPVGRRVGSVTLAKGGIGVCTDSAAVFSKQSRRSDCGGTSTGSWRDLCDDRCSVGKSDTSYGVDRMDTPRNGDVVRRPCPFRRLYAPWQDRGQRSQRFPPIEQETNGKPLP